MVFRLRSESFRLTDVTLLPCFLGSLDHFLPGDLNRTPEVRDQCLRTEDLCDMQIGFEIVTSDDQVQKAVKAIVKAAKTGKIGDGKVFVLGIEEGIRIRTGQHGADAV